METTLKITLNTQTPGSELPLSTPLGENTPPPLLYVSVASCKVELDPSRTFPLPGGLQVSVAML